MSVCHGLSGTQFPLRAELCLGCGQGSAVPSAGVPADERRSGFRCRLLNCWEPEWLRIFDLDQARCRTFYENVVDLSAHWQGRELVTLSTLFAWAEREH